MSRRRLVHALIRRYGPPSPRILDVGCGTGGTLDALADLGEVTGLDLSDSALGFCRRRGHTRLVRSRAEAVGMAGDSFDVAVCCDVIEHLDNDQEGLAEVFRLVKPGGIAVITVPAYKWLWSAHDEALSHKRRYEKRELAAALKVHGVQVEKLTFAVSLVLPVVLVFRLLSRLRVRDLGRPHTQTMAVPGWLSSLLLAVSAVDTRVVTRAGFPWGVSLVAVARKPVATK